MEIEIITTRKKLTKAIVKQLEPAKLGDLNYVVSTIKRGFYIRGLGKMYAPRVAVFEGINKWCIISIRDWKPVGSTPRAESPSLSGRGVSVKSFDSVELRDMWLDAYNEMKSLCTKNHLIL